MKLHLDKYILDIDFNKTKHLYKILKRNKALLNYTDKIDNNSKEFFNELGIDISKAESAIIYINEDNFSQFRLSYKLFGRILSGQKAFKKIESNKIIEEIFTGYLYKENKNLSLFFDDDKNDTYLYLEASLKINI